MDNTADMPTWRKLDVDDDHRMAEAGILGEDDQVELIDREIMDMAPVGQGHAAVVDDCRRVSQPRRSEPT